MRPLHPSAVPPLMIERSTELRLKGAWRAACRIAHVRPDPDPRNYGRSDADLAEMVEAEMRHVIPDLLRWHLPRDPYTGLLIGHRDYVLSAMRDDWVLVAHVPGIPQHIILRAARLDRIRNPDDRFLLVPDRWDARRTGELLTRCGGPDPLTSRPLLLDESGRHAEAWAAAGFDLQVLLFDERWGRADRFTDPEHRRQAVEQSLAWLKPAFAFLPEAARRIADETGLVRIELRARRLVLEVESRRVRLLWNTPNPAAERAEFGVELSQVPSMPLALARRPPELTALLRGDLSPDDLHPVAYATLFPGRSGPHPRPAEPLPTAVRIRCGAATHTVRMESNRIVIPHTEAEIARERALVALGGEPIGCLAALDGWSNPRVPMPRAMRRLRDELILRATFGDVWSIGEAVGRGFDPEVRRPDGMLLRKFMFWTAPYPDEMRRPVARWPA